jgi:hypothetical protein
MEKCGGGSGTIIHTNYKLFLIFELKDSNEKIYIIYIMLDQKWAYIL